MMAEAYRNKALDATTERGAVAAAALMEGAKEALEWVNGSESNRFAGMMRKIKNELGV